MKSATDLYTDEFRTRIVGANDPDARFLIVNAGREISEEEVRKMAGSADGRDAFLAAAKQAAGGGTSEGPRTSTGGATTRRRNAPPNTKEGAAEETKGDDEPHTAESLGALSDEDLLDLAPDDFKGNRDELVAAILAAQDGDGE